MLFYCLFYLILAGCFCRALAHGGIADGFGSNSRIQARWRGWSWTACTFWRLWLWWRSWSPWWWFEGSMDRFVLAYFSFFSWLLHRLTNGSAEALMQQMEKSLAQQRWSLMLRRITIFEFMIWTWFGLRVWFVLWANFAGRLCPWAAYHQRYNPQHQAEDPGCQRWTQKGQFPTMACQICFQGCGQTAKRWFWFLDSWWVWFSAILLARLFAKGMRRVLPKQRQPRRQPHAFQRQQQHQRRSSHRWTLLAGILLLDIILNYNFQFCFSICNLIFQFWFFWIFKIL